MGRNSGRASASVLVSGQCPRIAPDSRQPTWMIRANECASGRNSRVAADDLEHLHERALDRVPDVGEQVAVGDLASLGAACGARGVDDRREVSRLARGTVLLELLVGDAGTVRAGDRAVRALDQPDVLDGGDVGLADRVGVRLRLGERGTGARVAQDPLDLLGRRGLVDRHGDRARGPDRVVDQGPLVPRPRHQRDPVARADAGRDEPLGQGRHLVAELPGGDVTPSARPARFAWRSGRCRPAAVEPAHHDRVRLAGGAGEHHVGKAGRRGDVDQGGDAVLAHDVSCLT